MKENTNKAIVINSLILYGRLFICMACGLFSTRYALQALGAMDYGLFAVVGSIISFITLINTIMVATSNRFLAVAIGKGNVNDINEQFNVNLIIHGILAVLVFFLAIIVGHWYIGSYLNYSGDLEVVYKIYDLSIIGSAISILGIPYNGLLMAKEKFIVFSLTDVFSHVLILVVSYLILFYFDEKLTFYTYARTIAAAFPTIVFIIYCRYKFKEITKIKLVTNWNKYREMFGFSIWIGYGALATVGKAQGAAIIVNNFFNTIMNTAMGLAGSVNGIVSTIAQNVASPIAPQITKSYAAGDMNRSIKLVCISSRYSFLVMLLVASPFFIIPNYILGLWLGEVPVFTVTFTVLMIIDALIGTLNAGIPTIIFATGNVKWYQIITNTLFLLSIVAAYFVLHAGFEAYYLQVTYIVFSLIVLVVRQILLNKVVKFNNRILLLTSYLPSLTVFSLFLPCCIIPLFTHPLLQYILSLLYLLLLEFFIGINKGERQKIIGYAYRLLNRLK